MKVIPGGVGRGSKETRRCKGESRYVVYPIEQTGKPDVTSWLVIVMPKWIGLKGKHSMMDGIAA